MDGERDLLNWWLEKHLEDIDVIYRNNPEAYDKELDRIERMAKLALEYDKVSLEADNNKVKNDLDEKTLFISNLIDVGKTAAKITAEVTCALIPYALYQKWLKWGFRFEERGVFTSHTFKGLFGRMRPSSF